MNDFKPGETLFAGPTQVTFIKYIANAYGNSGTQAAIAVGMDTRLVDPVSLRRAS